MELKLPELSLTMLALFCNLSIVLLLTMPSLLSLILKSTLTVFMTNMLQALIVALINMLTITGLTIRNQTLRPSALLRRNLKLVDTSTDGSLFPETCIRSMHLIPQAGLSNLILHLEMTFHQHVLLILQLANPTMAAMDKVSVIAHPTISCIPSKSSFRSD